MLYEMWHDSLQFGVVRQLQERITVAWSRAIATRTFNDVVVPGLHHPRVSSLKDAVVDSLRAQLLS